MADDLDGRVAKRQNLSRGAAQRRAGLDRRRLLDFVPGHEALQNFSRNDFSETQRRVEVFEAREPELSEEVGERSRCLEFLDRLVEPLEFLVQELSPDFDRLLLLLRMDEVANLVAGP